jgi:hypothetical protein
MRSIYVFLLSVFFAALAHGQNLEWVTQAESGTPWWHANAEINVYNEQAVVVAGFTEMISITGHTLADSDDADLIARFTKDGSVEWMHKLPGRNGSFVIDGNGDIFVACVQRQINAVHSILYIQRYSKDGVKLAEKAVKSISHNTGTSIKKSKEGKIFLTANELFRSRHHFFVAELLPDCSYRIVAHGTGGTIKTVHPDAAGNLYITGTHNDTIWMGDHMLVPGDEYHGSYFVIKITENGEVAWSKGMNSVFRTRKWKLAVNPDNSFLLLYEHEYGSTNVRKFDESSSLLWSRDLGQTLQVVSTMDMRVIDNGDIYFTGYVCSNGAAFGGLPHYPGPFCSDTVKYEGCFIARTDSALSCKDLTLVPFAHGLSVAATGSDLYLAGNLPSGMSFGDTVKPLTNEHSYKLFIAKYSSRQMKAGVQPGKELPAADSFVYPNPTAGIITLNAAGRTGSIICIYNMLGECIYKGILEMQDSTIDLSGRAPGTYTMIIDNGNERVIEKIMLN